MLSTERNLQRRKVVMAMQKAMQEGRLTQGIRLAEQWRAAGGTDWLITLNLAVCLSRLNTTHRSDPIALAKEALSLSQGHPTALLGSAEVANNSGHFEWALELLDSVRVDTVTDHSWQVHQLKAAALARIGRADSAHETLERWPEPKRDWRWLIAKGDALTQDNKWKEAEGYYRTILREQPGNPLANQNLALVLLSQMKWEEGWKQYEWRLSNPRQNDRGEPSPLPPWTTIRDGTVVIVGEQGIGDQIMMARYLPLLADQCGRLIFQPAARLQELMRRSLPKQVEIRHPQDPIITNNGKVVVIGSGSLPLLCQEQQGFCTQNRQMYLHADPPRVEYWKRKLLRLSSGRPCVGVGWLGGSNGADHRERQLPKKELKQLTSEQGILWVDLQYLPDDLKDLRRHRAGGCQSLMQNPGENLEDTAALIQALDAVITTRQTVAHMAGALGVPGVVLVPERREWRYAQDGKTWAWYPWIHLSHQSRRGDWDHATTRALKLLKKQEG
jgi:Flp pilus assembly protein TadD